MTNETTDLSKVWKRDDDNENDYTLSQVNDFLAKSQITRLAEVVESMLSLFQQSDKVDELKNYIDCVKAIQREENDNLVGFCSAVILKSNTPENASVFLLSPFSKTVEGNQVQNSTLLKTLNNGKDKGDDGKDKGDATIYLPVLGTTNQIPTENTYFRLPYKADLKSEFENIFVTDQGGESSCTAHVGIALMEYYQRISSRSKTERVTSSPMFSSEFLYHVTQELDQQTTPKTDQQDSKGKGIGHSLRDMMRALNKVGVVPEATWRYNRKSNDDTPSPICYAEARNYRAVKYVRLDRQDIDPNVLLVQVKALLLAGLPVAFGFDVDDNLQLVSEPIKSNGEIPLPKQKSETGHAVIAMGYDDNKVIGDSTGALQIRNSWGQEWGDKGYGWLPYDYVLKGHTADWWILLKADLVDDSKFGLQSKPLGDPRGSL